MFALTSAGSIYFASAALFIANGAMHCGRELKTANWKAVK
jgi:hypothetical protein